MYPCCIHACLRCCSPEAFAFLCDELTRGIQRKAIGARLIGDVHKMLASYLEDTFFCFLKEGVQLEVADAAVHVRVRQTAPSSFPFAPIVYPPLAHHSAPPITHPSPIPSIVPVIHRSPP